MAQQVDTVSTLDYHSETYKVAYSRINAIAIEGEQHAFDNFLQLAQLLPGKR